MKAFFTQERLDILSEIFKNTFKILLIAFVATDFIKFPNLARVFIIMGIVASFVLAVVLKTKRSE